jgi:hypothetical protein
MKGMNEAVREIEAIFAWLVVTPSARVISTTPGGKPKLVCIASSPTFNVNVTDAP